MQELGHNFIRGNNDVTWTKVSKWRGIAVNNWYAFLWYISDYATINEFGQNWFRVLIVSDKQLGFFYNKVKSYNDEVGENNYNVAIRNDLWKSHKLGIGRNPEILQRLIKIGLEQL